MATRALCFSFTATKKAGVNNYLLIIANSGPTAPRTTAVAGGVPSRTSLGAEDGVASDTKPAFQETRLTATASHLCVSKCNTQTWQASSDISRCPGSDPVAGRRSKCYPWMKVWMWNPLLEPLWLNCMSVLCYGTLLCPKIVLGKTTIFLNISLDFGLRTM